jgi:hypothetical protein
MEMHTRAPAFALFLSLLLTTFAGSVMLYTQAAHAQARTVTYRCKGDIGGVASAAIIEIQPGGNYGGPYVAGRIQNNAAAYTFTGELFGGTEGYIALVDQNIGARIDRVWIGIGNGGFGLRTEDGTRYTFSCGG